MRSPTSEQIAKFKDKCKRCRNWDKDFMKLVENANYDNILPMTLFKMGSKIWFNEDIAYVTKVLENNQATFTKDMLDELAPHFEVKE
jgi:hypothetical protein